MKHQEYQKMTLLDKRKFWLAKHKTWQQLFQDVIQVIENEAYPKQPRSNRDLVIINRKELAKSIEVLYGPNVYLRYWYGGRYGRWIVDHSDYSLIYGFPLVLNTYRFKILSQAERDKLTPEQLEALYSGQNHNSIF